jgi:hypothetical protein
MLKLMKKKSIGPTENPLSFVKSANVPPETKAQLESRLSLLRSKKSNMLPVEQDVIKATEKVISEVEDSLRAIDMKYPLVDPAFLAWRKNGWPTIAMFNIEKPVCEIRILKSPGRMPDFTMNRKLVAGYPRAWDESGLQIKYPVFYENYMDVWRNLAGKHWGRAQYPGQMELDACIRCTFTGAIPDTTRAKINEARNQFSEIFLAVEAPVWEKNKEVSFRDPDPLVLGMNAQGQFFLIDKFDLTPTEEYIVREFTT